MNNVNIYLDCSGSWMSDEIEHYKDKLFDKVNQYDLTPNVYYFSERVSKDIRDARVYGGTSGQSILDHIEATKPNSVIIVTDADINDCTSSVTVPGFVWLLFRDGEQSKNLIDHLHGSKNIISRI